MKIIIPCGSTENLATCLESIHRLDTISPDDIYIVDDTHTIEGAIPGIHPFIFSRNVNEGLRRCIENKEDALVVCDDVTLKTPNGFTRLATLCHEGKFGILSPGIDGECGNFHQRFAGRSGFIQEKTVLCFICVFIPYSTLEKVGLMDEQFTGYGYDDIDYCRRVMDNGLTMGVTDEVMVEHRGKSMYRTRPDYEQIAAESKVIYERKWGA